MALRALSGVVFDPALVGVFAVFELLPVLYVLAVGGCVGWFFAAEAVKFSAGTGDCSDFHEAGFGAEEGALVVGAVADVFVHYGVAHADAFAVEFA